MKEEGEIESIIHIGHVGSGGLFGPNPHTDAGKWLNKLVDKCLTQSLDYRNNPHVIVFYGEMTEGRNYKGYNEDIWIPRIHDQINESVNFALQWITPDTQEILVPYAHTYHGSKEFKVEDIIAEKLVDKGFNANSSVAFRRNYHSITFRFRHFASQSFVYLASAKERTIKMNLQQVGLGKIDGFDREYGEHSHQYFGANFSGIHSINVRCLKLPDTYAQMKGIDNFIPDLGIIVTKFVLEKDRYYPLDILIPHYRTKMPFTIEELQLQKRLWWSANKDLLGKCRRAQITEGYLVENGGMIEPD